MALLYAVNSFPRTPIRAGGDLHTHDRDAASDVCVDASRIGSRKLPIVAKLLASSFPQHHEFASTRVQDSPPNTLPTTDWTALGRIAVTPKHTYSRRLLHMAKVWTIVKRATRNLITDRQMMWMLRGRRRSSTYVQKNAKARSRCSRVIDGIFSRARRRACFGCSLRGLTDDSSFSLPTSDRLGTCLTRVRALTFSVDEPILSRSMMHTGNPTLQVRLCLRVDQHGLSTIRLWLCGLLRFAWQSAPAKEAYC